MLVNVKRVKSINEFIKWICRRHGMNEVEFRELYAALSIESPQSNIVERLFTIAYALLRRDGKLTRGAIDELSNALGQSLNRRLLMILDKYVKVDFRRSIMLKALNEFGLSKEFEHAYSKIVELMRSRRELLSYGDYFLAALLAMREVGRQVGIAEFSRRMGITEVTLRNSSRRVFGMKLSDLLESFKLS